MQLQHNLYYVAKQQSRIFDIGRHAAPRLERFAGQDSGGQRQQLPIAFPCERTSDVDLDNIVRMFDRKCTAVLPIIFSEKSRHVGAGKLMR